MLPANSPPLAASHRPPPPDLVGFTSMSRDIPPEEVIIFLNSLFGCFDRLVEKHRVQKVRSSSCGHTPSICLPPAAVQMGWALL